MKLILANNQSGNFRDFYASMQRQSSEPFDYSSYQSLLFHFNTHDSLPVQVWNLDQDCRLSDYSGVYINGYLKTYELAAATAIVCDTLKIPFVNTELRNSPSLSKLTMYAKLASARVPIPPTIAGTKRALLRAPLRLRNLEYPLVLKRADADRGIDNYKVTSFKQVKQLLKTHDMLSLWLLQSYVPNQGFYLVSYYGGQPAFSIYRSLEVRPDGNALKAHMYKPKGGVNAQLITLNEVPSDLMNAAKKALIAMKRQIGTVDCLYDAPTNQACILEVNYNPQLVTVSSFQDVRIKAFLEYMPQLGE